MLWLLLMAALPVLYLRRSWIQSKILFPIGYMLYAHTPVGAWLHRREVSSSASSPPHSTVDAVQDCGNFFVVTVPYLKDNYVSDVVMECQGCRDAVLVQGYLVVDVESGATAAVDPADDQRVLQAFNELTIPSDKHGHSAVLARMKAKPKLDTILTTHKVRSRCW